MAASETISSHGAGEGGCVDQLRDMAGLLGFTLLEYTGYTLFGQSPRCELTVHIYPRGGTHGIGLHQDPSHHSAGLPGSGLDGTLLPSPHLRESSHRLSLPPVPSLT
ncbi:hypothetical protein E2562_007048 [Oryza meyeriana var. granulata]|uniref:Uncharacterized protein n=1 Tax=Oryza meyeriana var. granulata TaxID=110450 RepID=A0A6G1E9V7_9ORYZ|nr:hypothetical protein E2562_007048 [Oryza meyeriana var. granulata]